MVDSGCSFEEDVELQLDSLALEGEEKASEGEQDQLFFFLSRKAYHGSPQQMKHKQHPQRSRGSASSQQALRSSNPNDSARQGYPRPLHAFWICLPRLLRVRRLTPKRKRSSTPRRKRMQSWEIVSSSSNVAIFHTQGSHR